MAYDKDKVNRALVLGRQNLAFYLEKLKGVLDDEVLRKLRYNVNELVSIAEYLIREIDRNEKETQRAGEINAAYSKWMAEKETVVGLNREMDTRLVEKEKEIIALQQELDRANENFRKYKEEIGKIKEISPHQRCTAEMCSGRRNAYRSDVPEEEVYRQFQSGVRKEVLADKYKVSVKTIERRISKMKKLEEEAEEKAREELDNILKVIGLNSAKSLDDRRIGETYYELKDRLEAEEKRRIEEEERVCQMLFEREKEIKREIYGKPFT